ncbi:hypothetical protein ABZ215_38535 [Amycolatopsis sp. NPDC006131]|uniref:hypothetical protein n=1 Tax=Amycolatopsis sp. NPDC006131 TaxID=3156731 RepID=UPI0033BE5EF1
MDETAQSVETAAVTAAAAHHDTIQWRCHTHLDKYDADGVLYDTVDIAGNLLMYGGVSVLWQALVGNGTTTAGQNLTYFNNAQAAIGVGDSNAIAVATQNDLQASTNKLRKAMDSTYPQHTDATTSGAATITFRATFGSSDANWTWNEWGIFNSTTNGTGRMLNRKVEALGTKASGSTWVLTLSITLS